MAGIFVIAAAAFLIIVGIRGSQHSLFPGLFGDSPYVSPGVSGVSIQGLDILGKCYVLPNPDLSCPSGTTHTTTASGKVLCHKDGCQ